MSMPRRQREADTGVCKQPRGAHLSSEGERMQWGMSVHGLLG